MQNFKPYKGTRDFSSKEVFQREYVFNVIKKVYESYGFLPLKTPSLERINTLLEKYGEEGNKLIFKILKRGVSLKESVKNLNKEDENFEKEICDIALRYDLTIPLVRYYMNNKEKLPKPFRRYQIQPVWRADNPNKGRFREFYQCDVDIIGTKSFFADIEVCNVVSECLIKLGFSDFKIQVNNRELLFALIRYTGIIDNEKILSVVNVIDKFDKIGKSGVNEELEKKGCQKETIKKLFELLFSENNLNKVKTLFEQDENILRIVNELETILRFAKNSVYTPYLARGLDYYTGSIFEIKVDGFSNSFGGGGRYDNLIKLKEGKNNNGVSAVGFSLGVERILEVMKKRDMFPNNDNISRKPEIVVGFINGDGIDEAFNIAKELREKGGFRVETLFDKNKPSNIRKMVDERGIEFAVILNGDDVFLWSSIFEPEIRNRVIFRDDLLKCILDMRKKC